MQVLETPAARSTDPITSDMAADTITAHTINQTQIAILESLREKPLTYDELVIAVRGRGVNVSPQRVRTSAKALRDAGMIRAAEVDGRSMAGHRAKRWERSDA